MKKEKIVNSQRRALFASLGLGALAAGIANAMPLKFFIPKKKTETTNNAVSVEINPLAVSRGKRKTASSQRELA